MGEGKVHLHVAKTALSLPPFLNEVLGGFAYVTGCYVRGGRQVAATSGTNVAATGRPGLV